MKKRFIFFTLLLLTLIGGANWNVLNAQEIVEIGEGSTNTSNCIPSYNYYGKNTYTQQIYTKGDINAESGKITSILFKKERGNDYVRHLVVYLENTTKSSFDNDYDWVTLTTSPVFEGDVNWGTGVQWIEITLDTPFEYNGNGILLSVYDNTSTYYPYSNYDKFYTFSSDDYKSMYKNSSTTIPGTTEDYIQGTRLKSNNQIRFTFAAAVEPSVPTNLVATTQDYESIALTWETAENAKSYNIYQNGEKIYNVTGTSYVATGLNELTEYSFTITSVNGSKESAHSNTATAKTTETPTPDTPTNLIATFVSYNEINLKWDAVENAKSYNIYFGETLFGNSSTTEAYCSNLDANTAYKFTVTAVIGSKESGHSNEVNATSVSADAQEIALGEVRMGDYLTEKTQVSKSFNVTKAFTSITSILPDDDFFTVSYDSSVNPIIVNVSYDKTANKTGEQTANIIIKSSDFEDVVVTVSATAYTPSEGDVKELAKQITLNGSYTDNVTGMYDDYILPGETNDGNNGDAVYSFTLTEDALITANVEGTNALAAIYKAEELANNVPSSNNNYEGKVMEVAPTTPTTFFYDFEDGSLEDFNLVEYDGNNNHWQIIDEYNVENKHLISYSYATGVNKADNYIITKSFYGINANSKLSFDAKCGGNWNGWDKVMVKVSTDGEVFTLIETVEPNNQSWVSDLTVDLGAKFAEKGLEYGNYYIALHHQQPSDIYNIIVDNLRLSDGSAKSRSLARSVEPQINAVHYEAGEYYLVAAAEEGNFTLNISTATLPAPEATVYTAPENGAIEQNNPKLSWTFGEYTDKYQVLLGTTNPPTDVVVEWTSELATSFQTELSNNTVYYWQVNVQNAIGTTTTGEVYSFITPLNQATELAVTDAEVELYPGETTTLTWTAAEGALSYNVYLNGTVKLNETAIEETSFELTNLPHNVNPGNAITVTAVHTLGESAHSEAIYVKMAGEFNLVVNVKDAKGNAIENAAVAFNTESYYDEYYQLVPAIETLYTDAEGKATKTLAMPCVYGSPYWYNSNLEVVISKEYATSQSVWITSYTGGLSAGQDYVQDITLEYIAPENVQADKYYYVEGEDMVLTWNEVEGAVGYNVYKVGYSNEINDYVYTLVNEEAITGTTFTVENLKYDLESLYVTYAVTADYGFVESAKNAKVYPGVTGEGQIAVTVTDGTNPIKGATVTLVGYDGFDRTQTYTFVTNEEGKITGDRDMLIGSYYTATVSHYDYNEKVMEEYVAIEYQTELSLDIVLEAKQAVEFEVTAAESGDYVNVTWEAAEGATSYNVYRRDSEGNVQRIYSDVTSLTATDYYWTLEAGTYEYGVSAKIENGMPAETFSGTNIPEGWTQSGKYQWQFDGKSAYINKETFESTRMELISPLLNLNGIDSPKVTFKYNVYSPYWSETYTNNLIVYASESLEGPWTELFNKKEKHNQGEYQNGEALLSAFAGKSVYVKFSTDLNFCFTYIDDVVFPQYSANSKINWSNEVVREAYATFNNVAGDNDWSNEANWSTEAVPAEGENVIIAANANLNTVANVAKIRINGSATLTLNDGAELTVTGTITQLYDSYTYSSGKLVINDGAQLFQSNENVYATFNMNIVKPSSWSDSNKDGWQFIASPFNSSSITNFVGLSWAPKSYDLYKYEGNAESGLEWNNHKDGNFEEAFVNGRGYLASYETLTTATLSGNLYNKDNFEFTEVSYTEDKELANFHLLGNPFSFDMDWSGIAAEGLVDGYAVVNNQGGYDYLTSGNIKVGDGFFVKATGANASLSYNHKDVVPATRGSEKANSINVIATSKAGKDNVVVNFAGQAEGFNKLQNFNDAIATVYVSENGKNYGIANVDENTTEVALNFDAKEMGNYTISLDVNGEFETVTLVDRFTGVETNMLVEDEYSFIASNDDNVNRFVIRLAQGSQLEAQSQFVYQSGEELILSIEGSVQIVDMLGRVVYSNEHASGNNRIYVGEFNDASYVVRVINEEGVKVQKVVIY